RTPHNIRLVQKLKEVGVKIEPTAKKKPGKLTGKTFVFTGELESMSREAAKAAVRTLGGDATEAVSRNTDYVVAGFSPGSKYDRAKKLGVKILTEKEFLAMIH
ncbi:MAG: NAD-dependent DNA ligase LigA, partial [Candidatus Ryanbacteria bacterium]|nr:NAD-dependent DNA ligase LigA [Candidatus Ryanbacteria bacterium]